ncbi:MAG: thymidine phosphorylase [Rhodobacteraceae bacterium]|nr:thymidine phosphorylase [Paracoccaceae bacterium]
MDVRGLIAGLRQGDTPDAAALHAFAAGLASGAVSDAQAGAFAMAVCLNGLGEEGRVALTIGMRDSGDVMTWDMPGPVLDKHSTGGVGDCVSLVLAPALAACGAYVPMISGRGLGHTGGTLDKLEAIPGLNTQVSAQTLRDMVGEIGCAIVGASGSIAPADKRLYAIRDVTATVSSVDLITASILSKKLAAGLEGLILDVKCGAGAFMKTRAEAQELAEALVLTANGAGCKTAALITDMSQPLVPSVGNALEVALCMEVLADNREAAPKLYELTLRLGGALLGLVGIDGGAARVQRALSSGDAMERFTHMVAALGGPPDIEKDWHTHLPKAPVIGDVLAQSDGYISAIDGERLGFAVVGLGGGRAVETDLVDPAVGFSDILEIGTKVSRGMPIMTIHAGDGAGAEAAAQAAIQAVTLAPEPPISPPLILERVGL